MGTRVWEFHDFSAGEYGRAEAWRAPKNAWTGNNVLVYRTGELGVRPGVRDVTPSGTLAGVIAAMGAQPGQVDSIWYAQTPFTNVRTFGAYEGFGAVVTAAGTFTVPPGSSSPYDELGTKTYIITTNSGAWSFDGTTLSALTGSPNGLAIAIYGDRGIIVPSAAQNTIRYSDAANLNSWPAGNTITVGESDAITAVVAQRGHLAILKGTSGLFVLTGVPGVNDTLRQVTRQEGPGNAYNVARTRDLERLWYVPSLSQNPTQFDGTRAQLDYTHPIFLRNGVTTMRTVPLKEDDPNGFVMVTNRTANTASQVWLYYKGAWSQHSFGVTITGDTSPAVAINNHGYPQNGDADYTKVRYGTKVVFSDGGGAAATPNFYAWQPFMDRPGLEASPFAASAERAGDASASAVSGNVTFPEQRLEDGSELQVRGVIVDFRKWQTGASNTNHFDLAVNTLRSYEAAGTVSSATASWDEANSAASLAGTLQTKYFSFGDQGRGGGFQLAFTNMRGIAIQRIKVITETYPPRM